MIQPATDEVTDRATRVIASGGVVAFKTDTFYGLGVDPFNPIAVRRIFELKGREEGKPILVLISDLDLIEQFISDPGPYEKIAKRYWPAALTLVGAADPNLPEELTAGTGTIGLRLPDDEAVRDFVDACGGALTATSANVSGQPAARTASEVQRYFPVGIDLIVDGGAVTATEASTVVDVTTSPARLIREGAMSRERLKDLLG